MSLKLMSTLYTTVIRESKFFFDQFISSHIIVTLQYSPYLLTYNVLFSIQSISCFFFMKRTQIGTQRETIQEYNLGTKQIKKAVIRKHILGYINCLLSLSNISIYLFFNQCYLYMFRNQIRLGLYAFSLLIVLEFLYRDYQRLV